MKITVLGTGYVGIVTSVVFADFGNDVVGLDVIEKKVDNCNKGIPPIHEPRLEEFLKRGLKSGRLTFTTSYKKALEDTEAIFICVGTPQSETGEVDLTYVESAIKEIAKYLDHKVLIVLKSTVPPGVHKHLSKLVKNSMKVGYEFASAPEFLREGSAINDTLNPTRIVLGVQSKEAEKKLIELHRPLPGKRIITDVISAQMIKYAANGFLATKISFANAIARVCDLLGADVNAVMDGIGTDTRIGRSFLYPGLGFGGSCFPKDIKGLYYVAKDAGYEFSLIKEVDNINRSQVEYLITQSLKIVKDYSNKKVAMLGLAFKPDTDDMRDARSVVLIRKLIELGASVTVYDPIATDTAKLILKNTVKYTKSAYDAIKNVDILFIATEWNEFKELDMKKVKTLMSGSIIIDGRNIYDPKLIKDLGFKYLGVGRR